MTISAFHLHVYSNTIIQLIVDDLKIIRLLHGLSGMSLDTSLYETKICDTVLFLLMIKDEDEFSELKDWYFKQTERMYLIEASDQEKIFEIAQDIFEGLSSKKAS